MNITQKVYQEESGDCIYDDFERCVTIKYEVDHDRAYMYDDRGDEIDITPYIPEHPSLSAFEEATADYLNKKPLLLYRPNELERMAYERGQQATIQELAAQLTAYSPSRLT
jgi:hypothetical protein